MVFPQTEPLADNDPWDRESCSHRRVHVEVDDGEETTAIPITALETSFSRDGKPAIKGLTSVKFPAEWDQRSVVSRIQQFSPSDQQRYSVVNVYLADVLDEEWRAVQRGWVRSAGGAAQDGIVKMWIDDAANLLNGIPVSRTFDDPTLGELTNFVETKIRDQTVFENCTVKTPLEDGKTLQALDDLSLEEAAEQDEGLRLGQRFMYKQTFEGNRDTLSDAISWFTSILNLQWSFAPDGDGDLALVLAEEPTQQTFVSENVDEPGDEFRLIENAAAQEIAALNSVTVQGSSGTSIAGHTVRELSSGSYPEASARYPPLIRRSGQELQPPIVESDVTDLVGAEAEAKKRLYEQLASSNEGDMELLGKPQMRLGDRIVARPLCGTQMPNSDPAVPLEYEVENVRHVLEGSSELKTRVNVSVWVDRKLIEVSSHMVDT